MTASLRAPATTFDSRIFGPFFGAPEMAAIFADTALVQRYVEVEIALARAQVRCGIVPAEAANAIAAAARDTEIDINALGAETEVVGYPIVGIVHQLARNAGEAGRYVHWGATTQDIMDTATVLQVRDALGIVEAQLERLSSACADLARQHRDTPMAGRTHLQHALPVTFGHKAAVWLSMLQRHQARIDELKPRVLVGQFAGAAGTLASLGDDGLAVQSALMEELGLGVPDITWHVARDNLAETVGVLGLITGTLAKIATDVMLMMMVELGEAYEPFVAGRGSSSTMPQKRNPISCELILAAHRIVRQQAGLMLDGMAADFERATGPWHLEWVALPEAFLATAGALRHAGDMLGGLDVQPDRMRANLDLSGGLIVAEAVMMALAEHTGRQVAHDVIYAACRRAMEGERTLLAELQDTADVTAHLSNDELARLVEPANYLGSAQAMVDRVLASFDRA